MSHSRMMLAALALTLAIVAGSTPRIVGDGGEYVAMALNFANGHGPSLKATELPRLLEGVAAADGGLAGWNIEASSVAGEDERRDFLHFWFYPLLASPIVRLTNLIGLSPVWAFTTVNVACLAIALSLALPRIGAGLSALLFLGPIIWFIDKPHTEAFTFSLLMIAMLTIRDRPWWSLVAAATASTQNPPIILALGVLGVAALARDWRRILDRRFQVGAAVALGIAALHPAYYYSRYGTPSLLLKATNPGIPSAAEIAAVPFDAQIGLLPAFPLFGVVLLLALFGLRKRLRNLATVESLAAVVIAAVFLFSFARTANIHHGATPSFSRYGLWLVPLAVPLLAAYFSAVQSRPRPFMTALACLSATLSVFPFHPAVPSNQYEPTSWARFLWWSHPGWSNPVPEIFMETIRRQEVRQAPVATPTCSKVLLATQATGGHWPTPCYPAEVPASCRSLHALCYANLTASGYVFVRAPGRRFGAVSVNQELLWPPEVAATVRKLYDDWDWRRLRTVPDPPQLVRASEGVRITALEGDSRVVLVLQVHAVASMLLRLPVEYATGEFIDPHSGAALSRLDHRAPVDELWRLDVPPGHPLLLLRIDYQR